jgi:hypothetical protein
MPKSANLTTVDLSKYKSQIGHSGDTRRVDLNGSVSCRTVRFRRIGHLGRWAGCASRDPFHSGRTRSLYTPRYPDF